MNWICGLKLSLRSIQFRSYSTSSNSRLKFESILVLSSFYFGHIKPLVKLKSSSNQVQVKFKSSSSQAKLNFKSSSSSSQVQVTSSSQVQVKSSSNQVPIKLQSKFNFKKVNYKSKSNHVLVYITSSINHPNPYRTVSLLSLSPLNVVFVVVV